MRQRPQHALHRQEEFAQILFKVFRLLQRVGRVVERVLPRVEEEEEAELRVRARLERVADRDKVFQAFAHFAPGDGQMARVEKVSHPIVVPVVRLRLRWRRRGGVEWSGGGGGRRRRKRKRRRGKE